jgi:hypothetical protein
MLWAMLLVSTAVVTPASRVYAEPAPPDLGRENLFHLAAEGGYNTPLGRVGLAVEIHPLRRLVLAGGLGLYTDELGHFELALAVSSRFRLFLLGNTSLSAGLGLSREDRPPQRYEGQVSVYREWNDVIRLNPEISLEHHFDHRWAVRGFVGLGVVLTHATCTTYTGILPPLYPYRQTQGSCLSPDVPAPFRHEPDPLVPYAGLAIDASWQGPPPAVEPHAGIGPTIIRARRSGYSNPRSSATSRRKPCASGSRIDASVAICLAAPAASSPTSTTGPPACSKR